MLKLSKKEKRQIAIENATYPQHLVAIDRSRWLAASLDDASRIEVWRSREFLVQVFAETRGAQRMTVSRTRVLPSRDWRQGITWDDLQRLKAECGREEMWAVEIYPSASHLVDMANMRHLWLLQDAPQFAWVRGAGEGRKS